VGKVYSGALSFDDARRKINEQRSNTHFELLDHKPGTKERTLLEQKQAVWENAFKELEDIKQKQMDRLAREASIQRNYEERMRQNVETVKRRISQGRKRISQKEAIKLAVSRAREQLRESRNSKGEFRKNMYMAGFNIWTEAIRELKGLKK
jgi:hypothetical protein